MTKTKKYIQENVLNNSTLPKYKTQDNANKFPEKYEKIDPISETIPNETYSLREIVEKFSREYPKHLLRTGYYDEFENEDDFDNLDVTRLPDFDYVDAQELKEELQKKHNKKTTVKNEEKTEKKENINVTPSDV